MLVYVGALTDLGFTAGEQWHAVMEGMLPATAPRPVMMYLPEGCENRWSADEGRAYLLLPATLTPEQLEYINNADVEIITPMTPDQARQRLADLWRSHEYYDPATDLGSMSIPEAWNYIAAEHEYGLRLHRRSTYR